MEEAGNTQEGSELEAAAEEARARWQDARAGLEQARSRLQEWVRERPGLALVCAVTAGFVIGRIVRRLG